MEILLRKISSVGYLFFGSHNSKSICDPGATDSMVLKSPTCHYIRTLSSALAFVYTFCRGGHCHTREPLMTNWATAERAGPGYTTTMYDYDTVIGFINNFRWLAAFSSSSRRAMTGQRAAALMLFVLPLTAHSAFPPSFHLSKCPLTRMSSAPIFRPTGRGTVIW